MGKKRVHNAAPVKAAIRTVVAEKAGGVSAALSRACGWSKNKISALLNDHALITPSVLSRIRSTTGADIRDDGTIVWPAPVPPVPPVPPAPPAVSGSKILAVAAALDALTEGESRQLSALVMFRLGSTEGSVARVLAAAGDVVMLRNLLLAPEDRV